MKIKDIKYPIAIGVVFEAFKECGNFASKKEIEKIVSQKLEISDKDLEEIYPKTKENMFSNKIRWSFLYLRKAGLLENGRIKNLYYLTTMGKNAKNIDGDVIYKKVLEYKKVLDAGQQQKAFMKESENSKFKYKNNFSDDDSDFDNEKEENVKKELFKLDSWQFEKFCVSLLRTIGHTFFLTQKSRDGGVDGEGEVEIAPLIRRKAILQCKHYTKGNVSSRDIRDFNGSRDHKFEKIFITSGNFTPDAKKKANECGINLIDIEGLITLIIDQKILEETKIIPNKIFEFIN